MKISYFFLGKTPLIHQDLSFCSPQNFSYLFTITSEPWITHLGRIPAFYILNERSRHYLQKILAIFSFFFICLFPGAYEFICMAHTKDFAEAGDSGLDLLPAILSKRLHPGGEK